MGKKVRFGCNSGANIHSTKKSEWIDVENELGYSDEEWDNLSEDDKYKEAESWAWNSGLEIWYEEE